MARPRYAEGGAGRDVDILLVEDEELFAKAVAKRLTAGGHLCTIAGTIEEAARCVEAPNGGPGLVLLDERLPDGSGVDFLQRLAEGPRDDRPAVIVMTAFSDVDHAVRAMKLGALDYLKKPVDLDQLSLAVERVRKAEASEPDAAQAKLSPDEERLIGESDAMRRVRDRLTALARIATDGAALPTVLIFGETGTGKDLAARILHRQGACADRAFVQVDCASLPKDLVEAELFGHEAGAFTGARGGRVGLIEAAGAGTVFLDEIGEMPLDTQAKLLAVLDRRLVRRIGGNAEMPVKARFVVATNRDLDAMVRDGRFRADLFYRLKVLTLEMEPLRRCRDDLPALVRHFAEVTARAFGRPLPSFTGQAMAKLAAHDWPGNVRELKHTVERAVLLNKGVPVTAEEITLPRADPACDPVVAERALPQLDGLTLEQAERQVIENALRTCGGNVSKAAKLLNTTRMTLRYRIEKHGIRPRDDL